MQHNNRLTVSARNRDMTGSRKMHPQRISFTGLHAGAVLHGRKSLLCRVIRVGYISAHVPGFLYLLEEARGPYRREPYRMPRDTVRRARCEKCR
jgi:hypothetical protein